MFSAFVRTALVLVLVAQNALAYQCRCLSPEGDTANAVSESCCARTGGEWLGTDCNVGPSFTAFIIRAVKAYPTPIKSREEAAAIKDIGTKSADKIWEIISTGELSRIEVENTEDVKVTRIFQGIYGVGPLTALKWYYSGARTLEDVRQEKYRIKLSEAQRIGLHNYDDINSRMARDEAKAIFDLIKPIALDIDPKLFVEIMGSYRRGKADCGDIDIMITREPSDGKTHAGILAKLLQKLHDVRILTDDLALPENPWDLEAIYRGLCHLPKDGSRKRRIDFLTVPWKSRGAALLYYTGDDIFNRAMRLKANHAGYSLNQKGLFGGESFVIPVTVPSNWTLGYYWRRRRRKKSLRF
ncbi:Nucleotidyltransferase [Hymenopellis radicata]|nr:Nucleotidyltransferase [Hymenopellis radicata]